MAALYAFVLACENERERLRAEVQSSEYHNNNKNMFWNQICLEEDPLRFFFLFFFFVDFYS